MSLIFGFMAPYDPKDLFVLAENLVDKGFGWIEVAAPTGNSRKLINVISRLNYHYRFSVHSRYLGTNLAAPNESVRKASLKVISADIDFALRIGADRIVIHGGDTNWYDILPTQHPAYTQTQTIYKKVYERCLASMLQSFSQLVSDFRDAPILLAIENLYSPWEMLINPEEMRNFLRNKALKGLHATLDMGHLRVAGHESQAFLQAIKDDVRLVHIHENDGVYDLHQPLTHLPIGWDATLKSLHELPIDIPLVMEWQTMDTRCYQDALVLCAEACI